MEPVNIGDDAETDMKFSSFNASISLALKSDIILPAFLFKTVSILSLKTPFIQEKIVGLPRNMSDSVFRNVLVVKKPSVALFHSLPRTLYTIYASTGCFVWEDIN